MFFTPFGHGVPGWGPFQGTSVYPTYAVFSLDNSKMEISTETTFSDIMTTQSAQISHVKHRVVQYDLLWPLD